MALVPYGRGRGLVAAAAAMAPAIIRFARNSIDAWRIGSRAGRYISRRYSRGTKRYKPSKMRQRSIGAPSKLTSYRRARFRFKQRRPRVRRRYRR